MDGFHVVQGLVQAEPRIAAGSDEFYDSPGKFTAHRRCARRQNL